MKSNITCAGVQWCVCLLPCLSLLGLASGVPLGEGLGSMGQHGRVAKLTGDRGQHIIKWTRLRSVTVQYSTVQYSTVQYSTVQHIIKWTRLRSVAAQTSILPDSQRNQISNQINLNL